MQKVERMRAAIYGERYKHHGGRSPRSVIREASDAVVGVVLGCVCGSDLWYYGGESPHALGPIGHEFICVVEDVGSDVGNVAVGDLVVSPSSSTTYTCPNCCTGRTSNCVNGGSFGSHGMDGGQREAVRVRFADATLVPVPGSGQSDETLRSLLSLSDVMCTSHHAAVSGGVRPYSVVAVVGDGAVGLCAIIASRRLGASRIIAMSRNPQTAGVRSRVRRNRHRPGAG
jgi:threonine dehydrogenase-like Zn-dependent dehydrogenase